MFKNAIISLLAVALLVRTECYAPITGPILYLSMAAVLFFALAAVEDRVELFKRRCYARKKLKKQLEQAGSGRKETDWKENRKTT